ncbi:MAG: TIGR01777 family oxidoreductase [Alphaproteobacteria bacterium]
MRIVVTGATGFIGRPLVGRLLDAGHDVVAWTRDPQAAKPALPARCEVERWHPGQAVDPALLDGVDAVIHLAGESVAGPRWTYSRQKAIRSSRVDGTRRIVEALGQVPAHRRPKTLVAASAIGFYGDRGDDVLSECAAPGDSFLASVCREWEAQVEAADELGLRSVMLRVGIVLGRDGGALAQMLPLFRAGVAGRLGSGRQWMSWIHLDDVVEMFATAVVDDRCSGPINAVAPEPVTNAHFTNALGAVLGRPTLFPVPAPALKLAMGAQSAIVLASQRVKPAAFDRLGFRFRHPALSPALASICSDLDHELVREQWIPRPLDEVFEFFSEARNLEKITPDFLSFRVLDVSPESMGAGTRIRYRLSLHGVPVWWTTLIESWNPGKRFVDVQESGPYALWHHTHEFEPVAGGTLVRDRVRYRLPVGALGEIVAGGFVRSDVERIFDERHRRAEELFGVGSLAKAMKSANRAAASDSGTRAATPSAVAA